MYWPYTPAPDPPVMAMVDVDASAQPGLDDEHKAALAYGRNRVRKDTPTPDTVEREGVNDHGHSFWVYRGEATGPNGERYYFGVSITRVNDRAVILMFEGQYKLPPGPGRDQEAQALRSMAEVFLGSVK